MSKSFLNQKNPQFNAEKFWKYHDISTKERKKELYKNALL